MRFWFVNPDLVFTFAARNQVSGFLIQGFKTFPTSLGKDSVAQLVEHNTFNVGVLGSSPSGITKAGKPAFFIYKGSAQYNQGYFLLKLGSVSSQVFPNDYF